MGDGGGGGGGVMGDVERGDGRGLVSPASRFFFFFFW